MLRVCPACHKDSISPGSVFQSNCECQKCRSIIGVHWIITAISFPIIALVAAISTVVVYKSFGYMHAIVLFPLPIGALGYIVARFSPLQVKEWHGEQESAPDA